jgi:hypothetical protein
VLEDSSSGCGQATVASRVCQNTVSVLFTELLAEINYTVSVSAKNPGGYSVPARTFVVIPAPIVPGDIA